MRDGVSPILFRLPHEEPRLKGTDRIMAEKHYRRRSFPK